MDRDRVTNGDGDALAVSSSFLSHSCWIRQGVGEMTCCCSSAATRVRVVGSGGCSPPFHREGDGGDGGGGGGGGGDGMC